MKLTKAIIAHGESVTELTFREPTGADVARNGYPFKIDGDGAKLFDAVAISKLIGDLAGIPQSSVGAMSVVDFSVAMGEVVGFFVDIGTKGSS